MGLRASSILALVMACGCTLKFPDDEVNNLFPCENDSHCISGYACVNGKCQEGEGFGNASDYLFVELVFQDPAPLRAMLADTLREEPCHQNVTSGECSLDTQCIWNPTLATCWYDCSTHDGDQVSCDATPANTCTWNSTGSTCDTDLQVGLACFLKEDTNACSQASTVCQWEQASLLCLPICDLYTTETACDNSGCEWETATSTCERPQLTSIPQPTMARVRADGSDLEVLKLQGANTIYRWDTNGVFGNDIRLGTGESSSRSGMASVGSLKAAVFPHAYLFTQDTDPGDPIIECGISYTLLYWQQDGSATDATPSFMTPLTAIQPNLFPAETTYNRTQVAFPHMLPNSSGSTIRIAYGATTESDSTTGLSECVTADGVDQTDLLFSAMPFLFASLDNVLAARTPYNLWLSQVLDPSGSPALTNRRVVSLGGNYPCRDANDCSGAGTCGAGGTCDSQVDVDGYLPKLTDHGSGVAFSHVTCTSGYGTECSGGYRYDIVAGTISETPSSFELENAQFLAADPSIAESDPIIVGDFLGNSTLYYLGIDSETDTIMTTEEGAKTVTIPRIGLYKRSLSRVGTAWTVSPAANTAAAPFVTSTRSSLTVDEPCDLGTGGATVTVTSSFRTENPMMLTVSPDGRYLAYAMVRQEMECTTPIFGSSDTWEPGDPVSSDIYVVDLVGASPTPVKAYAESCRNEVGMYFINIMPTFIENGTQLAFVSQQDPDAFVNDFYRLKLEDVGSSLCKVERIITKAAADAALKAINPELSSAGAFIQDSRTYIKPLCSQVGGTAVWWLGLAFVWWRTRRRRR